LLAPYPGCQRFFLRGFPAEGKRSISVCSARKNLWYPGYLPSQLVPELIEAGARVYIKKERKKIKVMIIYSKITKGTSKTSETTTGDRKQSDSVMGTYTSD